MMFTLIVINYNSMMNCWRNKSLMFSKTIVMCSQLYKFISSTSYFFIHINMLHVFGVHSIIRRNYASNHSLRAAVPTKKLVVSEDDMVIKVISQSMTVNLTS